MKINNLNGFANHNNSLWKLFTASCTSVELSHKFEKFRRNIKLCQCNCSDFFVAKCTKFRSKEKLMGHFQLKNNSLKRSSNIIGERNSSKQFQVKSLSCFEALASQTKTHGTCSNILFDSQFY